MMGHRVRMGVAADYISLRYRRIYTGKSSTRKWWKRHLSRVARRKSKKGTSADD